MVRAAVVRALARAAAQRGRPRAAKVPITTLIPLIRARARARSRSSSTLPRRRNGLAGDSAGRHLAASAADEIFVGLDSLLGPRAVDIEVLEGEVATQKVVVVVEAGRDEGVAHDLGGLLDGDGEGGSARVEGELLGDPLVIAVEGDGDVVVLLLVQEKRNVVDGVGGVDVLDHLVSELEALQLGLLGDLLRRGRLEGGEAKARHKAGERKFKDEKVQARAPKTYHLLDLLANVGDLGLLCVFVHVLEAFSIVLGEVLLHKIGHRRNLIALDDGDGDLNNRELIITRDVDGLEGGAGLSDGHLRGEEHDEKDAVRH